MSTRIACYGTLRAGWGNHRLLEDAPLIGVGTTVQNDYTMRSMGGFPAVYKGGNHRIVVEVYEVDDDQLARIDRLEGHPNWYRREVVDTTVGPAQMYIMPDDERDTMLPVIKSGDWARAKDA